jgi:molecular chaperone DnaJ
MFRSAITLLLLLQQSDVSLGLVPPRTIQRARDRRSSNAVQLHQGRYYYDYETADETEQQQHHYHHQTGYYNHSNNDDDDATTATAPPVEVVSLYDVLGISRHASPKDIKQAFRSKAKLYHPDANVGRGNDSIREDTTELFQEINQAYQILNDPSLKMQYDLFTPYVEPDAVAGSDQQNDLYYNMANANALPPKPKGPAAQLPGGSTIVGDDLQFYLRLSWQFAATGGRVKITIRRLETCTTCRGHGISSGGRLYDRHDRPCGHCHCRGRVLSMHRHPLSGHIVEEVITCPTCRGRQHHLDDQHSFFCKCCSGTGQMMRQREIYVDVPKNLRPGHVLRLRRCGNAGAQDGPRGDLYIFLDITPPTMFQQQDNALMARHQQQHLAP